MLQKMALKLESNDLSNKAIKQNFYSAAREGIEFESVVAQGSSNVSICK